MIDIEEEAFSIIDKHSFHQCVGNCATTIISLCHRIQVEEREKARELVETLKWYHCGEGQDMKLHRIALPSCSDCKLIDAYESTDHIPGVGKKDDPATDKGEGK